LKKIGKNQAQVRHNCNTAEVWTVSNYENPLNVLGILAILGSYGQRDWHIPTMESVSIGKHVVEQT
jgi:hypothetical protein